MSLNDKELRFALIDWLHRKSMKPQKIIEELSVNNGLAIADVVAIYKDLHCYEIKGDNDRIERILKQGLSYDLSFRKITLLTTEKHKLKALSLAPSHWGILIAHINKGQIKLSYARKTKANVGFSPMVALSTLWKSEMLEILTKENIPILSKDKNRDTISQRISSQLNKLSISNEISDKLLQRSRVIYDK
ncbi:sce7726 family protein [Proteus vulgaris]|uniref:Sce7726 family protein n=1 Tax=Proteus vulgaris TaxID=585 RepID=A0A6G6SNT7_PROVU|nr:sce7726 family protein [Proteus vulgaris]